MAEKKKTAERKKRATGYDLAHKQLMSAVDTLGRIRIAERHSDMVPMLINDIRAIVYSIKTRDVPRNIVGDPGPPAVEPDASEAIEWRHYQISVPDGSDSAPGPDVPF